MEPQRRSDNDSDKVIIDIMLPPSTVASNPACTRDLYRADIATRRLVGFLVVRGDR
jgi:hypothetical protein